MAAAKTNIPPPPREELAALLGKRALAAWEKLTSHVEQAYPKFSQLWNADNRAGAYELKYRRSGKTLCTFYAREKEFGFMLIFGRGEQAAFDLSRERFSTDIQETYDAAKAYHDGKWLMFEVRDNTRFDELAALLAIKRKPDA